MASVPPTTNVNPSNAARPADIPVPTGANDAAQKKTAAVAAAAMSGAGGPPPPPKKGLKDYVWSVLSAFGSPFVWIYRGISFGISRVLRYIFEDEEDKYFNDMIFRFNDQRLDRIEKRLEELSAKRAQIEKMASAIDLSRGLGAWLRLPTEMQQIRAEYDLLIHEIAATTDSIKDKYRDLRRQASANPDIDISEKEDRLKEQESRIEGLLKTGKVFFERSTEQFYKEWQAVLGKNKDKFADAFQKAQATTLAELQALQKSGKKIEKSKDVSAYYDYLSLFFELRFLDEKGESNKKIIKEDGVHVQICQLGSELAFPLMDSVGIRNLNQLPPEVKGRRGNTCWLNSCVQSVRRSPLLVEHIRKPLQRMEESEADYKVRQERYSKEAEGFVQKPGESEEAFILRKTRQLSRMSEGDREWAARQLVHRRLNEVLNVMEMGAKEGVNKAIENLEECLFNSPSAPTELTIERGSQKDVTFAYNYFLEVIGYQVHFQAHKVTAASTEVLRQESEKVWDFPLVGVGEKAAFVDHLEASAKAEVESKSNGQYVKQRRLSSLPKLIVTRANRFQVAERPPSREEIADAEKAVQEVLKEKKWIRKEKISEAVRLLFPEFNGGKSTAAIPYPEKGVVDLTKSFLTEDLPAEVRAKAKWRLISMASHKGASLNGGHFVSSGQGHDKKWRLYDDEKDVKELSEKEAADEYAQSYVQVWEQVPEAELKAEGERKLSAEELKRNEKT